MVHAQKRIGIGLAMAIAWCTGGQRPLTAQEDPPSRVARLNYTSGNVSMEPAGVDEWTPSDINRPFTTGDYLYADQNSAAELHLDNAAVRMGGQTSFGFLNLDDRTEQIKLTEGDLYIRVHNLTPDQVLEVDTPNAAVNLLRDGVYRFRVDANGNMSFVVVRQGQAEITGGGQAFTLNPNNSVTLTGVSPLSYDVEVAPQPDAFDQWSEQRDSAEAQAAASLYVPPTMIGSEDLNANGSWQQTPEYGAVWYPRTVAAGWAPYSLGHWAWIEPWGWTWIDSQPWGFAPFHYGRWAYVGNRWGWCPGPVVVRAAVPVRPYYAPALVAWFGGAHWGVGITAGGGPRLGWVPLGWGEVYTPAYHCSPRYFHTVNVNNTRIVNNVNITNVYNTVYVNKQVYRQQFVNVRAPNAVRAMPQAAFASGQAVRTAGAPVRAAEFGQLENARVVAPPVVPTRQALVAGSPAGRQVARPPAQVAARQVIARTAPPAQAPSFADRAAYLREHVGQPIDYQHLRESVGTTARPANVRQVAPAQAVAVRPGERSGPVNRQGPVQGGQVSGRGVPSNLRQPNQPGEPAQNAGPVNRQIPVQGAQPVGREVPPNVRQPNRPGEPAIHRNAPAYVRPGTEPAGQIPADRRAPAPREQPAGHGVPPNVGRNDQAPSGAQGYSAERTRQAPANRGQAPERPAQPAEDRRAAQPVTRATPANPRPVTPAENNRAVERTAQPREPAREQMHDRAVAPAPNEHSAERTRPQEAPHQAEPSARQSKPEEKSQKSDHSDNKEHEHHQ